MKIIVKVKGSAKSGFRGHGGRPGQVGGSAPKAGGGGFASNDLVRVSGGHGVVLGPGSKPGTYKVKRFDGFVDDWSTRGMTRLGTLDERFKDTIRGNRPVTTYHATSREFVDSIRTQGLLARNAPNQPDVNEGVYFTTSVESGEMYGESYAGEGGFAIIKFKVPLDATGRVKTDDYDTKVYGAKDSFVIDGGVPPNWIDSILIYKETPQGDFALDKTITGQKARDVIGYSTVILAPSKKE